MAERKKTPVNTVAKTSNVTPAKLNEMIRNKAYDIYRQRGNRPGNSVNDWITAERIVKQELKIK
ncbi:MAG: hypothetical protein A3I75_02255 [Deltaproteobacteria bacterium RIFCSPLOWO2_02_FULL_50_16]|nr:MAG: hypothetical protein A2053_02970 [Deltaproteobacteria bacterium GWA2_50_8]OGQ25751.1 MAG: hypothetical protein A3B79_06140 [Deltaproteobacteria bacterium RIFCSPHIGHO2_02_FULL_50_15]OGQ57012.1 MAG: hypothetical protein A3I75_02255 [Deltaproteobacteria bacterium RIFCSPLOWO2_02_FULL_50_16]OGQ66100.1 MAG: hypothetical protein A3F89_08100 [Deltaproteobacteria bacterium RIFCSPLOWO2_12_FULL_50_11]